MGVLTFPEEKIIKKWRLQPGKMLLIDLEAGRIIDDAELKKSISTSKPYRRWIEKSRYFLGDLNIGAAQGEVKLKLKAALLDVQQAFGYSQEDIKFIIEPMTLAGEEATGSMGNDSAFQLLPAAFRAGDESAD